MVTPSTPATDHPSVATAPLHPATDRAPSGVLSFEEIYASCYHDVSRWVRALGGPPGDVDDLTQDVFLVVRRKLRDFDGANLGGWLYRITQRTVRDHRHAAWFRRALPQATDEAAETANGSANGPGAWPGLSPLDPGQAFERKESARLLANLLARMSPKRRTAFVLYAVEGYSGEEIASIENISVNTVWTRLHHARRDLAALVDQQRLDQQRLDQRRLDQRES